MRFAYADPPYVGQAVRHYRRGGTMKRARRLTADPAAREVDQRALIARLVQEFPDGWALSCSTPSLRALLPACPEEARVASWVKPFAVFKPGVNPSYSWEPVIFCGGRRRVRGTLVVRDFHSESVMRSASRSKVVGAKPPGFCRWVFRLLGAGPEDDLEDLFPGSGAVGRAWEEFCETERLLRRMDGPEQLAL